jgi:hypothetical protein
MGVTDWLKKRGEQYAAYQEKQHTRYIENQHKKKDERAAYAERLKEENKVKKLEAERRKYEQMHRPKPQTTHSPFSGMSSDSSISQPSMSFFGSSSKVSNSLFGSPPKKEHKSQKHEKRGKSIVIRL